MRPLASLGVTLTLLILLVPPAAAEGGGRGTFEAPEVLDPADDVRYFELYLGQRPDRAIDILRLWLQMEPGRAVINITTHLADTASWQTDLQEEVYCSLYLDILRGGQGGDAFEFQFGHAAGSPQPYVVGYHHANRTSTAAGSASKRTEFGVDWNIQFARPGNLSILLPQRFLHEYGDALGRPQLNCYRMIEGGPVDFSNHDAASSMAVYTPPVYDAAQDPQSGHGVRRSTARDADDAQRVPAPGLLSLVLVLAMASLVVRRR